MRTTENLTTEHTENAEAEELDRNVTLKFPRRVFEVTAQVESVGKARPRVFIDDWAGQE